MGNNSPILHRVKRGLELPITGAPVSDDVAEAPAPTAVALLADDYVGMRPSFRVKEGDEVKRGQVLFEDRKNPGVQFTSPGCGVVTAIHRGERRALRSVVVTLSPADGDGAANEMAYASWQEKAPAQRTKDEVRALLVESGMWTALRTRPWSRIPAVDSHGAALFVTAMDSNPLAPKAEAVIARHKEFFETGLAVLEKLMDGRPVHCCRAAGAKLPDLDWGAAVLHDFAGPHPSGTAGLHIHTILPVSRARMVWHIGYPDVIAIGHLFATGRLFVERVISVAGPAAKTPGLVATRMGAAVDSLVAQTKCDGDICTISGSVFNGREAAGSVDGYLGRYHNQVTLLPNDRSRRLLGWMTPGFNVFSVTRLFASTFLPTKKFALSTDRFGGYRTMVPFSSYDKVMAFDLMAPFLLRALLAGDLETAEQLGALELDEEDLALCTFVCPSKNEYGPVLRDVLTRMEKEG